MPHPAFVITGASAHHRTTAIEQPVKAAFGTMDQRHAVYLRLEDANGHVGIGESWINFPRWAPWERIAAYEQMIIPWLAQRAVHDVAATIGALYQLLRPPAEQSGTVAALLQALCGLELALRDLAARNAGLPLAALLFDAPHRRVQVYASGINAPLPVALIRRHLERGVTIFKLKLGFGDDEDRRNLDAMKRLLGDDAELAVDVNRKWSIDEALRWAPLLADYSILWWEEPLAAAHEEHLVALRRESRVPLAGCENVLMAPTINTDAAAALPFDLLQPDITKYTPLHVALQLRQAGEALGKQVVPHFLGSGPGQAASIQLAAGCRRGLVEWDINKNPLRTELCAEPFEIVDGAIALPDRPGIGWSVP